jgi:hypothetical protein
LMKNKHNYTADLMKNKHNYTAHLMKNKHNYTAHLMKNKHNYTSEQCNCVCSSSSEQCNCVCSSSSEQCNCVCSSSSQQCNCVCSSSSEQCNCVCSSLSQQRYASSHIKLIKFEFNLGLNQTSLERPDGTIESAQSSNTDSIGNTRGNRRKQPTCGKSLTNFIIWCFTVNKGNSKITEHLTRSWIRTNNISGDRH